MFPVKSKVLVTGANGFLGGALCTTLQKANFEVVEAVRRIPKKNQVSIGELSGFTGPISALQGCDVIVHCAARVHVLHEESLNPLAAFRVVNVHGTLNLMHQAVDAGVRRFVYISSIGVNGAETFSSAFREADIPAPHSPYALSKSEAEIALRELANRTGLDVVIIRPPLIYGPSAPGNFGSLVKWLSRGVPLPLGAIDNRRSYVSLDNLIDLILTCTRHPAAADQTFLVSDGEDLSTTDLLRRMSQALGKPARLLPVPIALLKFGAAIIGKPELAQRLCGNLQLDISKARQLLGWTPPLSVDEGLKRTAEGHLREAYL